MKGRGNQPLVCFCSSSLLPVDVDDDPRRGSRWRGDPPLPVKHVTKERVVASVWETLPLAKTWMLLSVPFASRLFRGDGATSVARAFYFRVA